MQFRKYRKFAAISIILAFLLPALVTATVVISYTYPTSTQSVAPDIYLTAGPNYGAANAMNLIYANGASTESAISSGSTIYINTTSGSYQTALVNVLSIYNDSISTAPVYVTLYAPSSTSGITMYASTSTLTVTNSTAGISISGTQVLTGGTTFHLTISKGTALYIGFLLTGTASGSYEIVVNYQIS
ncbi:MAG: hypothetical protein QXZ12_06090 [Thermoplasmata archaeon]